MAKAYLHRYLRLTPTLAFTTFFVWKVLPLLGEGPGWWPLAAGQADRCRRWVEVGGKRGAGRGGGVWGGLGQARMVGLKAHQGEAGPGGAAGRRGERVGKRGKNKTSGALDTFIFVARFLSAVIHA